ncbi:hypothetical protein [Streptomyces griseofuscus]|uniref:hypothetical protein n=1 Tax=Streptomyces griseofuscus TaxID=146922 RepID=UPI0036969A74
MAELTTNSVVHGAGSDTLRIGAESDRIVCEVHDNGQLNDPLAGGVRCHPDLLGWLPTLCPTLMPAALRPERDRAAGLWLRRR